MATVCYISGSWPLCVLFSGSHFHVLADFLVLGIFFLDLLIF